jgi:pyruvate formate lyase activating enzyme
MPDKAKWFKTLDGKQVECLLCPRHCKLKPNQRGICQLRYNENGALYTNGSESISGVAIDPIEKKPLHHFLPNSNILSLGTVGCNLRCKFCQNWHISFDSSQGQQSITPENILSLAKKHDIPSVAFTYNEPNIWAEFIEKCSHLLKENNIHPVLVSNGYIEPEPRKELYKNISAINFDLKAFENKFYKNVCSAELEPVLNTLKWTRENTDIWMELTHLVIPNYNDDNTLFLEMVDWIVENLGVDTVLHLSAFHPSFKLLNATRTPLEMLEKKYNQAKEAGLNYVYLGNVHSPQKQTTYCPKCKTTIISRNWHQTIIEQPNFDGKCTKCGFELAGFFR